MDTIYTLTAVIGVVLALATGAGAYFAFKTSRNAQLIQVYQGTANAWEERARAYEVQIKELQAQNQQQATELADLRGQVGTLRDLATGRPAIDQLNGKVDKILVLLEEQSHGG